MNTSTTNLNNDLNKIKNWAIQWKMNFNPDPTKQAQEVILSRKLQKTNQNQKELHNHILYLKNESQLIRQILL